MKKKSATRSNPLRSLFSKDKARWLPLYHRLLARLSSIRDVEIIARARSLRITASARERELGTILVTQDGLQLALALHDLPVRSSRLESIRSSRTLTHKVLLSEVRDLDEELLSWIRAAKLRARTARRRST